MIPGFETASELAAWAWPARFFVGIVAGVLLAIGFQIVLTQLSLAAGASAAAGVIDPEKGSLTDRSRDRFDWKDRNPDRYDHSDAREEPMDVTMWSTARKALSGIGIWAVLTSSIALFFAAWLAVEMTLVISPLSAAILGLVIWSLFTLVILTIEGRVATSFFGMLMSTAGSAARTAGSSISGLLGSSPEARAVDTASEMARAVTDELARDANVDALRRELRENVQTIARSRPSAQELRQELAKLLDDVEIREGAVHVGDGLVDEEAVVTTLSARTGVDREQARAAASSVRDALRKVKEEAQSDKGGVDTAVDAALRVTGSSREEAERTRRRIESYLRSTGKPELEPERLKADIERLFEDPQGARENLSARLDEFDRDTAVALLAARDDMDREQAEDTVRRIEEVVGKLRTRAEQARTQASAQGQQAQTEQNRAVERAENRIRERLDAMNRPELDYDTFKHEVMLLFRDPKRGAEELRDHLRSLDRDSLRAIVAESRSDLDEEEAERLIQKLEETRDQVVTRVEEARQAVIEQAEQARKFAVRQGEEASKTAATAAWWAFGAAVVSGTAAALGGLVALV